mgnify:CR=1 FL=1
MLGVYVHIPFCLAKCHYCDFHSLVADAELVGNYLTAMAREIDYWARKVQPQLCTSLYVGGGTPTILSPQQLRWIIERLIEGFRFQPQFEFTVEANPGTITAEKLEVLAQLGVNRISLGCQAFQNHLLQCIGRVHDVQDIYKGVALIRAAGIQNFNLDLIYALPTQTMDEWQASLQYATELHPTHLSCYSLILEEDTPFFDAYQRGDLILPSEETEAEMFAFTQEFLTRAGYRHYEISNFALPQRESRHNLNYWYNEPYIGIGSGAHGYYSNVRYSNTQNLQQYISTWIDRGQPLYAYQEEINTDRAMDDTMMLGLRLIDGVSDARFQERFHCSYYDVYPQEIKRLIAQGLLEDKGGSICLTKQGIFLGNQVFSAFIR